MALSGARAVGSRSGSSVGRIRPGRCKFERVAPVGAVLGLDPAAPAGEVVAAAFLCDDALKAELADLLPKRFSVGVAGSNRAAKPAESGNGTCDLAQVARWYDIVAVKRPLGNAPVGR